ncbi:hypothetical protein KNV11_gp56 [Flavobacterium phage vB_FspP_elemoF_6-3D]|uniref:Uncharacterized protein n=1 Tax=Flavobacterium phage vB_FspP_elemoF_6-3D TaxID=2743826 RepID=A0A7D7JL60_9CAUD|nr:hypothetical protein KNV11_gp56 [Flavobacterium phage vB_FspP_elemoF_6-3D]QMP85124.1 hypothetical protein elemo25C_phanotate52 [Flavobacterium phage vB_FspP_elemoA_2-5C]QMP85213.1 hypothetical protein elemo63D_phanotate50 [Flavobacterium phage vB_FspP_elemoF_6-3D]QMP85392.1 hypothetical protein elemo89C_phanotate53 [Flavobacterium phage vB_FspP_elemoA_8-9C]QMP85837.1 hypothetical protein elemo103D_phanotate51 [Flavobacterium phage vB_FspP_elemoE_10-3D]
MHHQAIQSVTKKTNLCSLVLKDGTIKRRME